MKNFVLPALFFVFALSLSTAAQIPTPAPAETDEVVKITTTLIQADVSVTDKDGKQVTNLKPEDFEIFENGKKQEVTTFSRISAAPGAPTTAGKRAADKTERWMNLPPAPNRLKPNEVRRTVALVVDDFGIAFAGISQVKDALKKFVNEQMQPGDLVAVVRTSGGCGAFQQFTSDKRLLLAAIDKIKANPFKIESFTPLKQTTGMGGDGPSGRGISEFALGTVGALNFLIKNMAKLPGRKTAILFSEGFHLREKPLIGPNGSTQGNVPIDQTESELRKALAASAGDGYDQFFKEIRLGVKILTESANRAGVVINAIDARGLLEPIFEAGDGDFVSGRPGEFSRTAALAEGVVEGRRRQLFDTQTSLIYLSEETGGRAFLNNNGFSSAVQKAVDDLNGYYLLGYQPDEETFDAKKRQFNKFEIRVKIRSDLKVRHRSGFFGITDEGFRKESRTPEQNIAETLFSPFDSNDINLNFTPLFASDGKAGKFVTALLHVAGGDLDFAKEPNDVMRGDFEVLGFAFDANGKIVDSTAKSYALTINADAHRKLLDKGLVYALSIPIKKAGAYQLKIAFRDAKNKKVGSASRFVEIPNVDRGQLSISGLLLENLTIGERNAKLQNSGNQNSPNQAADSFGIQTDTATRQFKSGTLLNFFYEIYNARVGAGLQSQVRLFRDGQLIVTGAPEPVDAARKIQQGSVTLGDDLAGGSYVLQILVTDGAKSKTKTASQWIDFEVVR